MAMVQYQVMYHYIHPTTKKACTNLSEEKYDLEKRFIKGYTSVEGVNTQDVLAEQSADNAKFDMLFVYDGIQEINSFLGSKLTEGVTFQAGYSPAHIITEKFQRCKGEGYFVASTHASLQASLNAADALVRTLGTENVKVVKIVPLDITVGLE